MSDTIYGDLANQQAPMIVGCQMCYGRGFIFTRHYERFEEPGPWMQYICQTCEGKLDSYKVEDGWYHGKPEKLDDAIAWLRDATPPAKPFRIWGEKLVENPAEFYDHLRHCDVRFWIDQILRLYELLGDEGDGEI